MRCKALLAGLTAVLLGLDAWGFAKLPGMETDQAGELTSAAEAFANKLIVLEGEVESLKTMSLQSTQAAEQAKRYLEEGRETFRFDTFGSEDFWGGKLRLLASPDARDGSLKLWQDAYVYAGLIDGDERVEHRVVGAAGHHGEQAQVPVVAVDLAAAGVQPQPAAFQYRRCGRAGA